MGFWIPHWYRKLLEVPGEKEQSHLCWEDEKEESGFTWVYFWMHNQWGDLNLNHIINHSPQQKANSLCPSLTCHRPTHGSQDTWTLLRELSPQFPRGVEAPTQHTGNIMESGNSPNLVTKTWFHRRRLSISFPQDNRREPTYYYHI